MKSEDIIKSELSIWWNNLRTADTMDEVKFYQGNINALLWILTDEKVEERLDAFSEDKQ